VPDEPVPPQLRADAPLLDAYLTHLAAGHAPFTIPGHKGRAATLDPGLAAALDGDVPLFAGLDTIKVTHGRLADAERRAAALWGADWCRFSTGGATHANQALCLALGEPGDQVVVGRTAHRSTLVGLALAGLEPVWVPPRIDPVSGVPLGLDAAAVAAALAANPDAKAVLAVEPGYLGTVSDVEALARTAHEAGVPLVVDQAWGAHLGFHPRLPQHALALGADAMTTSAHKAWPAYSQAAIALARTDRLDAARLEQGFEAGNTTSPAGSVLASTDGARALFAARGHDLLDALLTRLDAVRRQLTDQVEGLRALDPADFEPGRFDAAKLVLLLPGTGADGVRVEEDLIDAGVAVEMADRDTIVAMVTVADGDETLARLTDALVASIRRHAGPARPAAPALSWQVTPELAMPPRDAFFADAEAVPSRQAVGRVCAELVAPYPPGVPVLAPGEVVTAEIVEGLQAARAAGTRVAYAADPTLETLRVVSSR
jgi:arginine decarboxylase